MRDASGYGTSLSVVIPVLNEECYVGSLFSDVAGQTRS